ncbi:MAG: hypothetical protein U9O20_00955 [Patescibacteria group bacterium]|nr:hypothetical protein [Patescibacteria group bacterium]
MKKRKYTRKITCVGKRSLSIVIPSDIVQDLDLRERQKMVIYRHGKRVIIEDWKQESDI